MSKYQFIEKASEDLSYIYQIQISSQFINEKINIEAEKLKSQVNIPGFRKDKVPTGIILQKYQKELDSDCKNQAIEESVKKLMEEKKFHPINSPKLVKNETNDQGDLVLEISFENMPEFNLPDYKELLIKKYQVKVTDHAIQKEVDNFIENSRSNVAVEDKNHAIEKGDVAVINYQGKIDGEAFEGGSANNHELEIGSKSFIDNFEEQLIGHKIGDNILVKVKFPDDYHSEKHAGKKAEFDVKITNILRKEPKKEANDEFFAGLGVDYIKNKKDFEQEVVKKLNSEFKKQAYQLSKKDLFDKLETYLPEILPKKIVDEEIEQINKQEKEMSEQEIEKLARRRVGLSLIFIEYADKNKIAVENQDYQKAIYDMATQFPGAEQQIAEMYMKNKHMLDSLHGSILEDKVVDNILTKVAFEEEEIDDKKFLDIIKEL